MQYHRGTPHTPAQRNRALDLDMLCYTSVGPVTASYQYSCSDPLAQTGVVQTDRGGGSALAATYDVDSNNAQQFGGPYHEEEMISRVDAWGNYRTCAEGTLLDARYSVPNCDVTLYAPVPVPGLLFSGTLNYDYTDYHNTLPSFPQETSCLPFQGIEPQHPTTASITPPSNIRRSQYINHAVPNTACYSNDTPTQTFPTPSELLVELAGNNSAADPIQCDSNRNLNDLSRRPRRRPMNKGMGLIPGDSRETISSHEKKRHYLECLEQYVLYLHQQLNLVGAEPVPLERVKKYGGLNNRSIRTLLVHMENTTKKLNLRTLREEQRFVDLRDAVYSQDKAAVQALQHQKMTNAETANM
ncbi:hypothetical protein AX15_004820 [Amanita polypyramis BW_CC]|nr:hypothetical protein AX15_004820 [Amanita polypyramis BW_CC]